MIANPANRHPGAQLPPRFARRAGSLRLAVSASLRLRDNALSKARFEPTEGRWAASLDLSNCGQLRWEDRFNLSFDPVTAREPERSGDSRRQYHDEPKRLAGAGTDCAKRSPRGEPAVRRWVHQTVPQDGAKSAHFCSMCVPRFLRHEPSRGIGGEAASRQAARRVNLPSGGRFSNITEDVLKYAAAPGGSKRSAAEIARQTRLSTNAGKQIIRRMARRASRVANQQAICEEEALAKGMAEKSKEFVESGAEVYQPA